VLSFRSCRAITMTLLLGACALQPVGPTTSIEQGDFVLLPETIVVGTGDNAAISAIVTIHGGRHGIAVVPTDCDDGVGSIRVVDDRGLGGVSEISAFARGARPADVLFNTLCAAQHRKAATRTQDAP